MQKFPECLEDFDRAMEKSEDNVAKYFYTRGLVYSEM